MSDATQSARLDGFSHVTGALGESWFPETVGGGVAILDMDGDGWQDIALIGGGTVPGGPDGGDVPAVRLYRNHADGTFEEVTREAGLDGLRGYGQGLATADYDNDGDDDLFVTAVGTNMLLRNEGGTFSSVAREAGLADKASWSTSALFFDADLDGFVDLYVLNYVDWSPDKDIWCTMDGKTKAYCTPQLYAGVPGDFYHNNGDGTFSNWTDVAGFGSSPGKSLGVAEWDFNQDGYPDLVVANDTQRDLLYLNNRDGTFREDGVASGLAFDADGRARAGMGIDVGVLDQTGRATVLVGHFTNEMIGVYLQIADGVFMDRAAQSMIGRSSLPTLTFGLLLADLDLDGDLDVFVANGHIDEDAENIQEGVSYRQLPQLFVNDGNGFFSDHGAPVEIALVGRALASLDFDRDGDDDLVVTENGGPVHLLRNDTQGTAVRVSLEGSSGNRDALGAQVIARVGDLVQVRRVRSGSSFLAASDKSLTFGLAGATRLDTLVVVWPGGSIETFTGLSAGKEVRIRQGTGVEQALDFRPRMTTGGS